MSKNILGWDIGGAHLKAVAIDGQTARVWQHPTPLWQGLESLHQAIATTLNQVDSPENYQHAVTMTGELVDWFSSREQGVQALIDTLGAYVPTSSIHVFAGDLGFVSSSAIDTEAIGHIASANWLATAMLVAAHIPEALLIDLGSTTTDLLIIHDGTPRPRGYTDLDRLRHQELVYSGGVRTSLMALARRAPWQGDWIELMAEHFATTADIYRLTGELPEHADQLPAADGGEKSTVGSARRLGRLLGTDLDTASMADWRRLAHYFRQQQLGYLQDAAHRQLSRGLIGNSAFVVGAGVGRFLVQELAHHLGHPYQDFADLIPMKKLPADFDLADCAPAASVAALLKLAL